MRKALLPIVLLGLCACAPSAVRADGTDVVDGITNTLEAFDAAKKKDLPGAALKAVEAINSFVKANQADLTSEELAALKRAVRKLQVECDQIPALSEELANVRVELDKKPSKQEVDALLRGLRADMDVELRKLDAKVDNLQHRVTDLEMGDSRGTRARLLLAKSGALVEGVTLAREPDSKGVSINLPTGGEKLYKPGEVEIVTTKAGEYHWIESKGIFAFHRLNADPSLNTAAPKNSLKLPENDSQEKKDAQLLIILKSMNEAQLDDLRAYGDRRGYDWDTMTLDKRLNLVKEKLLQDYRDEIQRMMKDTNCTDLEALRVIVNRLAK